MSISIAEAILEGANVLRKAAVPEPRREAGSLAAHVLERDHSFLLTHADDLMQPDRLECFRGLVERRAQGEPLQYITGHQEFFGLDFEVSPDVLIPRPETELLIETALTLIAARDQSIRICDVGTGSGCIAVTLLHELPNARAVALDISQSAIRVASKNAERHGVAPRIEFVVSDCFEKLPMLTSVPFDLIVSNPPYVADGELSGLQREVRDFEPVTSLISGPDGLSVIRRLLDDGPKFLRPGGHMLFEIGYNQSEAIEKLVSGMGVWQLMQIHQDLQGIPRTVVVKLVS
jgi:release factor glutamine methyltransferase